MREIRGEALRRCKDWLGQGLRCVEPCSAAKRCAQMKALINDLTWRIGKDSPSELRSGFAPLHPQAAGLSAAPNRLMKLRPVQ